MEKSAVKGETQKINEMKETTDVRPTVKYNGEKATTTRTEE
jgi:hypothetical protein